MEQGKDRFYFWENYWHALKRLPTNEDRGRFLQAMCEYAFEGREPDFGGDLIFEFAWEMVSTPLRESVEIGRRQLENGSKGGRPKGRKTTPKTTAKTTQKTSGLTSGKTTPKTTAETTTETTAKTVRYGSVPSDGAHSPKVGAPVADIGSYDAADRDAGVSDEDVDEVLRELARDCGFDEVVMSDGRVL